MHALAKLLYAFSVLCLSLNVLMLSKASPVAEPRALQKRFGSVCDTSHLNVSTLIPADINVNQTSPLQLKPIADHPAFVLLSVGVQNYTCSPAGTWAYVYVP